MCLAQIRGQYEGHLATFDKNPINSRLTQSVDEGLRATYDGHCLTTKIHIEHKCPVELTGQ